MLLTDRCVYPWCWATTEYLHLHVIPKRWGIKAATSHARPILEHVMSDIPEERGSTVLTKARCTRTATFCFVGVRRKITWMNLHISLVKVHAYTKCWSSSCLAISAVTRDCPSNLTSCWISYFATGTAAFMHRHVVFLFGWYTWWKHITWEVKSKTVASLSVICLV